MRKSRLKVHGRVATVSVAGILFAGVLPVSGLATASQSAEPIQRAIQQSRTHLGSNRNPQVLAASLLPYGDWAVTFAVDYARPSCGPPPPSGGTKTNACVLKGTTVELRSTDGTFSARYPAYLTRYPHLTNVISVRTALSRARSFYYHMGKHGYVASLALVQHLAADGRQRLTWKVRLSSLPIPASGVPRTALTAFVDARTGRVEPIAGKG